MYLHIHQDQLRIGFSTYDAINCNLELFDERAGGTDFRWIGLKGKEIHTLTIGIIGAGRIGGTAAKLFNA